MSIGAHIKRLRNEHNMTQEQLADYLGVTYQAVSQWECEKSMPDITQVPTIARLFDVSADILLDIDADREAEDVEAFFKEVENLRHQQNEMAHFDLTVQMYKKYPSNFRVICEYAEMLFYDPSHSKAPFGYEVHKEEIRRLCELFIRDCTMQELRYRAYRMLASLYVQDGNIKKAEEYARQFPDSYYDVQMEMLDQLYQWRYDDTKSR